MSWQVQYKIYLRITLFHIVKCSLVYFIRARVYNMRITYCELYGYVLPIFYRVKQGMCVRVYIIIYTQMETIVCLNSH